MKNINVCLLAAVACTYSLQATANSLEHNLNSVIEDNVYSLRNSSAASHTVTPLELEPILPFYKGVKFAAVCALGGGGCSGLGFNSGNNDVNLDNSALCTEQGYKSTGNCTNGTSPQNICPYDKDYFKSCACNTSIYTEIGSKDDAIQNCGTLSEIQTCLSDDTSYYSCLCSTVGMTTCSQKESYVKNADFCKKGDTKYFKNADCITCENPKIVNNTKDGCTCPSNWFECGVLDIYAEGVGSSCINESGQTFYESCTCPQEWKPCDSGGSGNAKKCTKNGIDYWSDCKAACPNTGTYASETDCTSDNAYLCTYEDCSTMWYRTGCAVNHTNLCSTTNNCSELGYTKSTSDCPAESIKCPYDTSKIFCLKPDGAIGNYYYSKGTIVGVIVPNTNMIMDLNSIGPYSQSSAISSCAGQKIGNKTWALPTEEEFRKISSEKTSINTSLKAIESTEIDDTYWTCTPDIQYPNMGYYCTTYGSCGNIPKSTLYPVRCITHY